MRHPVLLAILAGVLAGGCQRPLFPDDEPRTPYDRYGALREGETSSSKRPRRGRGGGGGSGETDLRERLKPLE